MTRARFGLVAGGVLAMAGCNPIETCTVRPAGSFLDLLAQSLDPHALDPERAQCAEVELPAPPPVQQQSVREPGGLCDLAGDSGCVACLKTSCCDPIAACSGDEACKGAVACRLSGAEHCDASPVYDEVRACGAEHCEEACAP